nr:MAG TPA: hypothetical protein [Caudoviricetes sp.]
MGGKRPYPRRELCNSILECVIVGRECLYGAGRKKA